MRRQSAALLAVAVWATPALAQTLTSHGDQSPAIAAQGSVSVTYGLSPEKVEKLTKAAVAGVTGPMTAQIVELSQKLGVTQNAALTLLRVLGQQDVSLEQLPRKLDEITAQYKQAVERLAALDPQDPVTRDLVSRAQAAIADGRLREADQLLDQAERIEVAAAREAQQIAQQAMGAADQRLLRAADAEGARGDIAMTELRYLDAAQRFGEAAGLVPAGHPDQAGRFLTRQADAFYRQGDERGDNPALQQAIAIDTLVLQGEPRARAPLAWAQTQNNLGAALERLGERESGTARLEEAVAAYRAALEERTRDRVPLDWAQTQNNLGNALGVLGERESGTARLEEAVSAYRAALEERTRDRVPLAWATTQNNLGNALRVLGERESGTARLEEAVAAYRAALEVFADAGADYYADVCRSNLDKALAFLTERTK